jgi:hypothetical protein
MVYVEYTLWACSSGGEHLVDIEKVGGSRPYVPTNTEGVMTNDFETLEEFALRSPTFNQPTIDIVRTRIQERQAAST